MAVKPEETGGTCGSYAVEPRSQPRDLQELAKTMQSIRSSKICARAWLGLSPTILMGLFAEQCQRQTKGITLETHPTFIYPFDCGLVKPKLGEEKSSALGPENLHRVE